MTMLGNKFSVHHKESSRIAREINKISGNEFDATHHCRVTKDGLAIYSESWVADSSVFIPKCKLSNFLARKLYL